MLLPQHNDRDINIRKIKITVQKYSPKIISKGANWSKINKNIKIGFNKKSEMLDIIKRRPTNKIKLFLDKVASKLIENKSS